jgi:hypothetical protein
MNNNIYIIKQEDFEYDSSIPHILGYVETESEAREVISKLERNRPQCPFDSIELEEFEQIMSECEYDLEHYIDSLYAANPYINSNGQVTDIKKYSKFNDEVKVRADKAVIEWMLANTGYTEDQIRSYWNWEPVRYSNIHYSFEEVEQI